MYRPKDWQRIERRKLKEKKKNSWSNKGGFVAPIFIPPTPNGELVVRLRKIATTEAEAGVNFRIVETGGRSIKRLFQVSNPMETAGCDNQDCLPCRTGRGDGGRCLSSGANYTLECQLCPDGSKSRYIGETSRNLYTRGIEHEQNYRSGSPNSFMLKHQVKEHQGSEGRQLR
jgi:hypothetical protein